MDLNDIRDMLRGIRAPEVQPGVGGSAGGGVDDLIANLRLHDAEEQAKLKQARVLFLVATALMGFAFVGICLTASAPLYGPRALHQGALLAVFVYLTLGLRKKMWGLSKVDYTRPAKAFLEEAEQRYLFMRPRDYVVMLCGLLLFGIASMPHVVGLFLNRYVDRGHYLAIIVLYGLFYLSVCAMGLYFTRRNWKRDKAPLLEDIRRMKDALKGEEAGKP